MNLNTATKEELLLIPGMGDRMVREFKEYRPYKDVAQFPREIGKYGECQGSRAAGALRRAAIG